MYVCMYVLRMYACSCVDMYVCVCVCVCVCNKQNIVQLDMTKKILKYGNSNLCIDNENTL